jgi:predicted membrane channel-forming protein YqfA (hemolysin III family)
LRTVAHSTQVGWHHLPTLLTIAGGMLLLLHGPIAQPAHYNDFADQSVLFGIPHAADVLSNIGFAVVAMWGWIRLRPKRDHVSLRRGWCGYHLFLIGLLLTAVGSAYYHLAPDNQRQVWDRMGISLACVGVLAAVRAETRPDTHASRYAAVLSFLAIASVAWWHYTDSPQRPGDLRPYVLLQTLPLVLVPLWQAIYRAPHRDRAWFGVAVLLYVLAKLAELWDQELLATLGWISGHTLKHLLAAAAAGVVVGRLTQRLREPSGSVPW